MASAGFVFLYICLMQFKKQFGLIMAFLVLVSNSGMAINVHFCEGKIAAISTVFSKEEVCEVPVKEETACCAKPDPTHKKCCSDKQVDLKNKTEKIVLKTFSFDLDSVVLPVQWEPQFFNAAFCTISAGNPGYHCDANAPPLYRLYCRFTLFG